MKQFEVGKKYRMASACNTSCIWEYVVVSMTAKTITIQNTNNDTIQKCRINQTISNARDAETVLPLGSYSMCPKLSADCPMMLPED